MVIKIIIFLMSAICGLALFVFFRRMPVEWLLEYDEKPNAALYRKQQIPFTPFAPSLIAACMLIAWLGMARFENVLYAVALFLICLPLLLIILADLRTRIIPDQFILAMIPCALLLWLTDGPELLDLLNRFLAGLAGGLALALIGWLGSLVLRQEAMGMGDIKLVAASGLAVGLRGILLTGALSFLLAAPAAMLQMIRRRKGINASASLAFGPFIALAVMIVLFFENSILHAWEWWLGAAFTG